LGRFCFYRAQRNQHKENLVAFPLTAKPDHGNPWNLTPRQEQVLLVYSRTGLYKATAETLGTQYCTVNSQLRDIRKKMKCSTITICAVRYSLWRHEQLTGVHDLKERLATALFQLELARKDLDFAQRQVHQQLRAAA